ncbi:MAG: thiamine permease [Armatimonadetes bacterium]|nr:thiamine permease [Armatimonadota bacterium]
MSTEAMAGGREPWSLRDFVVVGVIGLVLGYLFLQWVPVWLPASAIGPIAQEALFGFWFLGGILSAYIVRKAGAALLGEIATAFFRVFLFGSPAGVLLLVTGFMQGLGPELVFAFARYRLWAPMVIVAAGGALVALPWNWFRLNYFALDVWLLVALAGARVFSGGVLGGWLSWIIGRAFLRTGVLQNLAISRAERS